MNRELPDIQAGFRKGRGTRDKIANLCRAVEKGKDFQQNIYFCFIDDAEAFDCVNHNKLWEILSMYSNPQKEQCQRMFKQPNICAHFRCY